MTSLFIVCCFGAARHGNVLAFGWFEDVCAYDVCCFSCLLSNKLKAFSAFYYPFAAAAYTLTFARCRLSPFGLSMTHDDELMNVRSEVPVTRSCGKTVGTLLAGVLPPPAVGGWGGLGGAGAGGGGGRGAGAVAAAETG